MSFLLCGALPKLVKKEKEKKNVIVWQCHIMGWEGCKSHLLHTKHRIISLPRRVTLRKSAGKFSSPFSHHKKPQLRIHLSLSLSLSQKSDQRDHLTPKITPHFSLSVSVKTLKPISLFMDTEGLSLICAGLGIAEEDDNGNRIGYSKGQYCLGTSQKFKKKF